jgi:hypothetical protein
MGSSASKFSTGERGDVTGGLLPMEGNRNSKGRGESCLDTLGRFSEGLKELRFIDLRSAKRNYVFRHAVQSVRNYNRKPADTCTQLYDLVQTTCNERQAAIVPRKARANGRVSTPPNVLLPLTFSLLEVQIWSYMYMHMYPAPPVSFYMYPHISAEVKYRFLEESM